MERRHGDQGTLDKYEEDKNSGDCDTGTVRSPGWGLLLIISTYRRDIIGKVSVMVLKYLLYAIWYLMYSYVLGTYNDACEVLYVYVYVTRLILIWWLYTHVHFFQLDWYLREDQLNI